MINLNNYSLKFAKTMLHATEPDKIVKIKKVKVANRNLLESLQKLERELEIVQADKKQFEENYGPANLQLTIIKTNIISIFDNSRVVKWLLKSGLRKIQCIRNF